MIDQSKTLNLKMLEDMIGVTSSQESDCGTTPCNLQDGMIDLFGQAPAHVNRSLLPDDKKVKQMIATYGLNGSGSSKSVALQRSMESRLRQRLPTGGLTMFIKGWSRKATPLGRLYCQLAASVRPIEGRDYGLWQSPQARDFRTGEAHRYYDPRRSQNLNDQVVAMWPTPKASEATKDQRTMKGAKQEVSRGKGPSLSAMAMWATVTVTDANKRGNVSPRKNAMGLSETAALWSTPSTRDHKDTPGMAKTSIDKDGSIRNRQDQLGRQVFGSTVQTESKGSLNPEYPCWLMGIPNEWVSSIVQGMQSLHKSQQSLSQPLCLEDMMQ